MDWEYVIVNSRNLISVRASGTFSVGSFGDMIMDIQSDEQWQPGMDRLIDFSEVDFSEATSETIVAAGEVHRKFNAQIGQGRIAVVFGGEKGISLGRMYEAYLGSDILATVKSFRTADEARHWISEG